MKVIRTRQHYSSVEWGKEPWEYQWILELWPNDSKFCCEWQYIYRIEDCQLS